jgi:uncharacterized protein RhaS with RHS repeats
MQQRYYDPVAGRLLSVDPVTTDAKSGGHFNRYVYAENNPYKYRDPDGRAVETPWDAANVAMGLISLTKNIATGNYAGAVVDAVGIAVDAVATVTPGVPGGAATVINSTRAAENAAGAYKKYTAGGNFSRKTKSDTAERAKHTCEYCGTKTVPAKKSVSGVTPPKNEGQTDHIVPKSEGGTNAPSNAAHSCRECNREMSNTPKPNPRDL